MYRHIVERSVEDLALGSSIVGVSLMIKPEIPLFIIKVMYKEREVKNKLGDLARIEPRSGNVRVILKDEIDLGRAQKLVERIWKGQGRAVRKDGDHG